MKKNYLLKTMLSSSVWLWVYLFLFLVYAIVTVRFSQLLGMAFDVAGGGMERYWSFARELILITIAMVALHITYSLLKTQCKNRINFKVRYHLYKQIQKKPMSQFVQEGKDSNTSMLINDLNLLEGNYIEPLLKTVEEIASLLIAMVAIITINWMCSVFVLIVSFIPVIVPNFFMGKLQNKMMHFSMENETFLKQTTDCIEGFEVYKNYNAIQPVKEKFNNANKKLGKVKKDAYQYMDVLISSVAVSSNFMLIGILVFGMFLALNGMLTIGEIFAITFISGSIAAPLSTIASNLPMILGSKEIVVKYNHYFEQEILSKVKLDGAIKNISVKDLVLNIGDRTIIDHVSLDIEKGKKYAFVGTSGSGKSTLLKLILGYFDSFSGEILFNKQALQDIDEESLYQQISYIPQTCTLLQGTFKENITLFDTDIQDQKVEKLIPLVSLQEKVESLEKGLDTYISESGSNFSGGEKQRIAIARALLKNSAICFMDEATSALDHDNYLKLEDMLLSKHDTTLVSVTHRIEKRILSQYDKIFVFHQGQLCEQGSFNDLMKKKGYFFKLVDSQLA